MSTWNFLTPTQRSSRGRCLTPVYNMSMGCLHLVHILSISCLTHFFLWSCLTLITICLHAKYIKIWLIIIFFPIHLLIKVPLWYITSSSYFGSNINLSRDKPCEQWIVWVVVDCIGNCVWIIIYLNYFHSYIFIWGLIDVPIRSILFSSYKLSYAKCLKHPNFVFKYCTKMNVKFVHIYHVEKPFATFTKPSNGSNLGVINPKMYHSSTKGTTLEILLNHDSGTHSWETTCLKFVFN